MASTDALTLQVGVLVLRLDESKLLLYYIYTIYIYSFDIELIAVLTSSFNHLVNIT